MMISGRVAQPLVGLARLMDDLQEVRLAVGFVQSVINQKPEIGQSGAPGCGRRFEGALELQQRQLHLSRHAKPARSTA